MAFAEVHITGLAELRRAVRKVGGDIPADLREGLKGAVDIIGADARSRISSKTGRAAASVRAVSSGNTIWLKGGGARVPYYGWLEFGGQLPMHHPSSKKAMSWGGASHPSASARGANRAKVAQGRYIRPAIQRGIPRMLEAAAEAFDDAARRAGLY